jgi:hypothetical protein
MGITLSLFGHPRLVSLTVAVLFLCAFRSVLLNIKRPLIGPNSLLVQERINQYFGKRQDLMAPYKLAMDFCISRNCHQVGLICAGDDPEYFLWVLASSSNSPLHLEHVNVTNDSGKLALNFTPCAIILTYPSNEKEIWANNKRYIKAFELKPLGVFVADGEL